MFEMNVEYTDAPPTRPESPAADKMPCPYCGHLLPKDATSCDRCDWTRGATETAEGKASDAMAVLLSIIPGLGHIYKGHRLAGFLWVDGGIAPAMTNLNSVRSANELSRRQAKNPGHLANSRYDARCGQLRIAS